MKPVKNEDGVIVNAALLRADQVAKKRVLCPGCGGKTFESWPEGWDAHAAHKCRGLEGKDEAGRKTEYKATFRLLFR